MNDMTLPVFDCDEIYKLDTTGRLRTWKYEVQGNRYRTIAGLVDGSKVTSEWTVCTPKSQLTGELQARFEAEALRRKKLERTYHETPEGWEKPHFFEPMLAQKYKPGATKFPVYNQPKLDGVRCIARAEGLFTRQGKPITSCPHIEAALAPLFKDDPELVLDGELYNHSHHDKFEELISIIRKQKPKVSDLELASTVVQYHVYDVPSADGPYSHRATALVELLASTQGPEVVVGTSVPVEPAPTGPIVAVETRVACDQDQLDADYADYLANGYEGQMLRLDAVYEQKRSKHLLKRKEFLDDEFEIVELVEGQGNWSGFAKRVTCRLKDGRTFGAGIKGTQAFCAELWQARETWVGKQVTVQYFTPTGEGIPRFPIAATFHDGEKI